MSDNKTPNSIDRQLRDVSLPPGLLPRLREIATLGEVELDHRLRSVPIPDGLLDRLHGIAALSDAEIDHRLREVDLPRGIRKRIERPSRWSVPRAQWIGWAVAASLLAIVSGALYLSSGNLPSESVVNTSHGHRSNVATPPLQTKPSELAVDHEQPKSSTVGNLARVGRQAGQTPSEPATADSKPATSASAVVQDSQPISDEADQLPDSAPAPAAGPAHQRSIFGGAVPEIPPNLQEVEAPLPRGVSGPRVEGYDLVSELRTGRHPFVVPATRPALRDSRVPVWTDTSSYELARRMLAQGQLPPPSQIHTEDFLAAMDYAFPLPTGAPLGIRAAAGPAPWGPSGMSVMQIGIQAAKKANPHSAQPQVVATGVEIKVSFDPAAVNRYRLIGYELSGGGMTQAPLEEDLRSGQATTALYEVELKPNGPTEVAFVEVSWRDPNGETPHRIRQPIGRLQFLPSWRECALSLQTAVVAAEMAESLHNSNLSAASARGLDQAADLMMEINPALENRPEIVLLKRMMQQARSAKSALPAAAAPGS